MSCLNRFKGWCQENFPFIEDDFNAITDYQLMCKLKEYVVSIGNDVANLEIDYNELAGKIVELEEIVNSMDGEFDDLVEEFNSLKTLVESYNMRIQANANRIEQVNTNLQQLISLNINELKDYVDREDTLILAEISTINNNIVLIRKDIEVIAQGIPKVRNTGTIITLNDTIKDAPIDIVLNPSELTQESDPTPTSPQDIHVISGDNSIKVQNKNLLDRTKATLGKIIYKSGAMLNDTNSDVSDYIDVGGISSVVISFTTSLDSFSWGLCCYDENKNALSDYGTNGAGKSAAASGKLVQDLITNNIKYLRFSYPKNSTDVMLEVNTTKTSYVAHQEQVKPLTLGDIEYCKIGTYSDHFFKAIDGDSIYDTLDSTTKASLTNGKWYIQKNIGKVVLDGSESWSTEANIYGSNNYVLSLSSALGGDNIITCISNYFVGVTGNQSYQGNIANSIGIGGSKKLRIRNTTFVDLNALKTFLGTNNTDLDYVLANPTYIPLNDTLQQQLDDIYETLKAYDEQTNITQINHDLPFIMTAITMKKGSVTDEV